MLGCPLVAFALLFLGFSVFFIYGGIKTYKEKSKIWGYLFIILGIMIIVALMIPIFIVGYVCIISYI